MIRASSSRRKSATRSSRPNSFIVSRVARHGSHRCEPLERPRHLLGVEHLDLVAGAYVVVVAHADSAFEAVAYFAHVVFEPTQRIELALEDHDVTAQHAHLLVPIHGALDDHAAGDLTEFR